MSYAWMPLYWGDYLGKTTHLSCEEHGAYLLLIGTYWQRGKPLPDDDRFLATVTKSSMKKWKMVRPKISEFFAISEGHWVHERVEKELLRSGNRQKSAIANGRAGGLAKKYLSTTTSTSTKKERKKLTQPSAAKIPEKVNGTNEPADLHRAYYDTGVAYLAKFGKAEKDARTLLGLWSRDLGGFGQASQVLAQAQTIGSPDPVAYMQGACAKQKNNRNAGRSNGNGNGHTVVGDAYGSREWWERYKNERGYYISPADREKYAEKYERAQ